MAVTNYYSINGRMIGELTSGVATSYITDSLGSAIATATLSGTRNRYVYSPYGNLITKTGPDGDPKFLWNAKSGYRETQRAFSESYVRGRSFSTTTTRWTTCDPYWPRQSAYGYIGGSPLNYGDPSGYCAWCAVPCAPCAACLIDLLFQCPPGTPNWGQCVTDVWNNLPSWVQWTCGLACGACLICAATCIPKPPPVGEPIGLPEPAPVLEPTIDPEPQPEPDPDPDPERNQDPERCEPKRRIPPRRNYIDCASYYAACDAFKFSRSVGWQKWQWLKLCAECFDTCEESGPEKFISTLANPGNSCAFWISGKFGY